ncbi:sulfite exporter TauE/SafE family protein [Chelatococcus sambhunathii]|uniref:Sulfite exporter TauE/SafE family protein n=1 Tax=Chelatococcus sambhunathii TaxID=363953 RepID=A0ABU1DBT0_9HYPH|nr:cytochrome c biogenesis protein CcdA [Chelatococcus sambhunathii]MDR4305568.1 sulfite exporter TauE/SafE family protein [Chelatococcus sambhunathii]
MIATLGLAFLAGLLTLLSPCTLPIAPLAVAGAASEHRLGPLALAGGVALSFVAVGLFVATVGFALGLDERLFRYGAGALMVAAGALLLAPAAQSRFATAAGPAADWAAGRLDLVSRAGLPAQFVVGLLLGAVWSPCVGPTLGAASVLASRGENLPQVALTMAVFGLGAALPLLAIGLASRAALLRWRGRLARFGQGGRIALGLLLVATGLAVLAGIDKAVETALVEASPDWLNRLTTAF